MNIGVNIGKKRRCKQYPQHKTLDGLYDQIYILSLKSTKILLV